MLVPGGYLLYSTCALNPLENDGIMERVFKKFDTAESGFSRDFKLPAVIPDSLQSFCSGILPGAEKKKFGYHVVPDVQGGAGPLYFSLIRKKMVNIP
jgi:16S rRNA C967 or C1407 C5-methylase (RsmB/RsmF family)